MLVACFNEVLFIKRSIRVYNGVFIVLYDTLIIWNLCSAVLSGQLMLGGLPAILRLSPLNLRLTVLEYRARLYEKVRGYVNVKNFRGTIRREFLQFHSTIDQSLTF